jgi:hypothetical protein
VLIVLVVVLVSIFIFGIGINKTIDLIFPDLNPKNSTVVDNGYIIPPGEPTTDYLVLGISNDVFNKAIEKNCMLLAEIKTNKNIFELYTVKDETGKITPKIRETKYYMKDNEIWRNDWFFDNKIGVITVDDKYGKIAVIDKKILDGISDKSDILVWMHYSYIISDNYFCKDEKIEIPEAVVTPKPIEPVKKCSDCGKGFWNSCDEKECKAISESCVFTSGWLGGSCEENEEVRQRDLIDSDYEWAAKELGVDIATIKAVAEVESSGSGFLANGKPKILFEGHVFWRELKNNYGVSEELLQNNKEGNEDILYELWSERGDAYNLNQYDRLEKAKKLSMELTGKDDAANEAASWGKFQILGLNYKESGFSSVSDFVSAEYKNEFEHLKAFVNYIQSEKMVSYLKDKDWENFALRYNGP